MTEEAAISPEQTAIRWVLITLDRLKRSLDKKHVGENTGALKMSLDNAYQIVKNSDGTLKSIILSFEFYGRFVDMGVGKGVSLGDVREEKSIGRRAAAFENARRPKKWYSPTFAAEVHSLVQIFANLFQMHGISVVENNLHGEFKLAL